MIVFRLILILSLFLLTGAAPTNPGLDPRYQRPAQGGAVAISRRLRSVAQTQALVMRPKIAPNLAVNAPLIVIDPGHGGRDYGTYSLSAPKYQEKLLTLSSAMMLKRFLHQLGYRAVLTRKDDSFIELDQRAAIANRLQPLVFVSLHYNSAPNTDAEGVEIYYYRASENKERVGASKELAHYVLDRLLDTTKAKSRGVKHGNFAVIRETDMPAILIEGGFLTHPDERARIKDPTYLKQLAWGIALGIDDYVQSNH